MSRPEIILLTAALIWIVGPLALVGAGMLWQHRHRKRLGQQVAAEAEAWLRAKAGHR